MRAPEEIIGASGVMALVSAGYEIVKRTTPLADDEFCEVWALYPHKVAKPAAIRAYNAARKRGNSRQTILDGIRHYIATKPVDRPWLNFATFANNERWNDNPAPVHQKGIAGVRARLTREIENEQAAGFGGSSIGVDVAGGLPQLQLFDH